MPSEPFRRLEPDDPSPSEIDSAVSRIKRFEHLEIHARPPEPAAPPPPWGETPAVLCPNCGSPNEKEREVCWACFRLLKKDAQSQAQGPQDITLVLDRIEYRSSDPDLPPDVRALMDRIQKEGYSQQLLADWRKSREAEIAPSAAEGVQSVEGRRRNIIRVDGKVYDSDDPALPPDIKSLFDYVANNGVTPELMASLRQKGSKVNFRPATTATPSDGDLDFWRGVNAGRPLDAGFPEPPEPPQTPIPESLRPAAAGLCYATLPLAFAALGECAYLVYSAFSRYGPFALPLVYIAVVLVLAATRQPGRFTPSYVWRERGRNYIGGGAVYPWVTKTLQFMRGSFGAGQDISAGRAPMGRWSFAKLAFWESLLVFFLYYARPSFLR